MNFTVQTVEDDADEDDETFTVTLSSVLNVNLAADAASARGTIGNDDPDPLVTLVPNPPAIRESDDTALPGDQHVSTVTATLDRQSGAQTVVTLAAAPVAPATAADFTLSSGVTLTFAPYTQHSTGLVTLTAEDNETDAADKEVTVSATAQNGLGVSPPAAETVTILDDEPPPTPELILSPGTILESDDPDRMGNQHETAVTVTLSHPSSHDTTVTLSASEYFMASGRGVLTVPALATASSATVTLTAVDNRTDAPDRVVSLTAAADNTQGVNQPAVKELTIEDEDDPPVVTLELAADTIAENGGSTTVTARLSHPSSAATTVTVAALKTIALAAEFALTGADLTIPAGDEVSSGMATIAAVNNDTDAPHQILTVSGTADNTHGYAGDPESHELTITDDENAPAVTLHLADRSIPEANGTTQVTARLSHPSSHPTTITVTATAVTPAAAADFTLSGSVLTVAPEATSSEGLVTVTAVPNLVDAPDKQVEVSATADNAHGLARQPPALRLTIKDDDERGFVWVPEVLRTHELERRTYTVALSSQPTAQVEVEMEPPSYLDVYISIIGFVRQRTLTFTPASWSVAQRVIVYAQDDPNSVTDTLRIPHRATGGDYQGHTRSYEVVVADNSRATQGVVLSVDPTTVAEGAGATEVAVTARLDGAKLTSAVAVAVAVAPGTAVAADFGASPASFTLTIAAGDVAAARTVSLTPEDDDLAETDETVSVSGTTAATREGSSTPLTVTAATITIRDDEVRGVTIEPTTLEIDEGSDTHYTVVLDSKPTGGVIVTPSPAGDPSLTVAPPSLTFVAADWDLPQTVTVTAADDDDAADATVTVTHAVTEADYGDVKAESVTVQVLDDDERTVLLSPQEVFLDEGSDTHYTVMLGSKPTGTVRVRPAVSNNPDVTVAPASLQFTTTTWNLAQTVTVAARVDADGLQDAATVTHAVSGADYSANQVAGPDLAVTVTDVASTERIVLSVEPDTMPEGVGNRLVVVTATVDGAARDFQLIVDVQIVPGTAAATDFLADPATLRIGIPANGKTGFKRFLLNTIEDSDDEDNETVIVRGTSEFFTVTEATITIEDDDGVAFKVQNDAVTVREGDSNLYSVRLATRPSGPVIVEPSVQDNTDVTVSPPSLTFGQTTWDAWQGVTVAAAHDADGDDDTARVTHTGSGADYEGITGGLVSVTVSDDDETSTAVTLSVDPTEVAEDGGGATVTVTAALNGAARAAATEVAVTVAGNTATEGVDFAAVTGFTITIPQGQTEAIGDFRLVPANDDIDEGSGETLAVSGATTGLTVHSAALTISDDDERGIEITPQTVTVDEQDGSDYTVALTSEPTGDVEVRVTVEDNGDVTVSPDRLTFTARNWPQPQTVTVAAADDADGNDDTARIAHLASGADYRNVTGDSVAVTVTDDDERGVQVEPTDLSLSEGGRETYTVVLLTQPTGTVTVTTTVIGDPDVSVSPRSFGFGTGNWNRARTVTVTAAQDLDHTADTATVRHAVSGADYEDYAVTAASVSVTVDDDEVPSTEIRLSVSPERAPEARATRLTVTAELNAAPQAAPVTVTLELQSGTAQVETDFEQAAPVTLTIAAAARRGTRVLTLTPVSDEVDEDDETVRLQASTVASLTLVPAQLEVTIEDDDERGVRMSRQTLSVTEGRPGVRYTVRLESQPTAPVTVSTVVSGDSEVSVQPASLGFTTADWSTWQGLTVTVAHDADGDDEQATITHRATGGDYGAAAAAVLTVNVRDDDETSTALTLSVDPTEVAEDGGGATVTVTAALNGAARAAATEVAVTVAGNTATEGVDFAAVTGFTITIPQGQTEAMGDFRLVPENDDLDEGSGETLTVSGTSDLPVGSATLTIADDDTRGITASAPDLTVPEQGSSTYTVQLASRPSGEVTVQVSVSGNSDVTVTPPRLTFAAGSWNVPQPVTVAAADDPDGNDDTAQIAHRASGADYGNVTGDSVAVTVTDNDERGVQVTPTALPVKEGLTAKYTVVLLTQPTGTVTVTPEVTDNTDVTATPASLRFGTGNWNRARTVTVTARQDLDQTDDTATVTHEVSGADYEDNAVTAASVSVAVDDDDVPSTEIRLSVSPERAPEARATRLTVTAELNAAPEAAPVTVTLELQSGTAQVGTDFARAAPVTLTIAAGADRGTRVLTLMPVSDQVDEDDETVRLQASTVASLTLVPAQLEVTIEDDDERGVRMSRQTLSVTEGRPGVRYTVRLESQPTAPVTVSTAVSGDSEVSVQPASLGFTMADWNTWQGLTVTVAHDADGDDEEATITHRATGGDYGAAAAAVLTVNVSDDDEPSTALTLAVDPEQVAEDAGPQSVTVTVTLNGAVRAAPTAVTVTVVAGTAAGTAAAADFKPAQLTVTIPAQAQAARGTLLFEPVADAVAERDETVRVRGAASGLRAGTATLTIIDDDERGLALVPESLTFGEGGSVGYTVALTSQPTGTVRVDITRTGSPDVSLSTRVLTFPPRAWDQPQEVQVTALRDQDDDVDTAQLAHRPSGADYGAVNSVTMTVTVAERGVCHRSEAVEKALMSAIESLENDLGHRLLDPVSCDDVTDAMLAEVPYLYVDGKYGSLKSLQAGDFAGLSKVTNLWIHAQPMLKSLPSGVFEGLDSLQELWLFDPHDKGRMAIESISSGAFRGLPELREINLDRNKIEELKPGTFDGLNKLERLFIQDNELESLPLDDLERLPRLGTGWEHVQQVPDSHLNVGVWWAGNPGYKPGVELSHDSVQVAAGGTASYRLRFRTPPDRLGGGGTVSHGVIRVLAPAGLTVDPAELTFNDKNWFRSQTVDVTASGAASGSLTLTHAVDGPYGRSFDGSLPVTVEVAGTSPAQAAPAVTGQPAVSGPGEDGEYAAEERIEARVSFSDAVTVDTAGGTPALSLLLGEAVRAADYASGSGTAELVFALTVAEADAGAYQARAIANGLRRNGGAIRGAGGIEAVLDFGEPPRVTQVTVAPDAGGDGSWSAGESVALTLTFSEPVTVDTDEGTPTVGLLLGGSAARQAEYQSGAGTRALRFAYALATADGAVRMVLVTPDSLALNGGAVRSTTGLAVNLEHVGTAVSGVAQPELSVEDARVTEAAGASLEFAVRLTGTATQPVTVAWATADGTATAAADYEAGSGTLTFALGERAHTLAVRVLDDVHNEGPETLTVTLSDAVGARIGDGEATGTIVNRDPLPAAWLARFGRTAAEQVLAAVEERLAAATGGAAQASVAGRRLSVDEAAHERTVEDYLSARSEPLRSMAFGDLLVGSSFDLPLSSGAGALPAAGGGSWGLWGRGGWSQFSGSEGSLELDGGVGSGVAGADYAHGAVRAGLALAYSAGSGSYRQAGVADGTLSARLLSVHPYLGLTLHERLLVWGLLGYGLLGELEVDPAAGAQMRTDLGLLMGAIGARGTLLAAGSGGGFELTARGDALLLRIGSGAAPGLAASSAEVLRSRLLLEAVYRDLPLFGGTLTPVLEAGVRYDGGDAERGAGLVLGGGMDYLLPAAGLSVSARGQVLLMHERAGFREWRAGGALRFDPGAPGRGVALSVAPSWGVATVDSQRLWAEPGAALPVSATALPAGLRQLDAELSYGVALPGERGVFTPYAGLVRSDSQPDTWLVGTRLAIGSTLSVSLGGSRREQADGRPEDSLTLTATIRL